MEGPLQQENRLPTAVRRERLTEELAAETRKRAEAEAQVQEISLYNTAILEQAQVRRCAAATCRVGQPSCCDHACPTKAIDGVSCMCTCPKTHIGGSTRNSSCQTRSEPASQRLATSAGAKRGAAGRPERAGAHHTAPGAAGRHCCGHCGDGVLPGPHRGPVR